MIALFDTRLRDCHLPALSVVIRSLKHNIRTVAGPSSPAAARAIQVVSRQGHPTQTTSGSSQFGGILVVLSAALHPFVSQATSLCAGRLLHLVVGRVHMIFLYGVAAPKTPSQLALAFDLAQALRGLLQTLGTDALVVVVGDMNAVLHTTDRVVAVLYPWDELLCSLPKVLTHEFGFHDIHYEQHLRHTPHDAFHPSFFHCDGSPCSRLDQCFFSPSAIAQSRSALPSMATMSALARSPGVKREYRVDHSMGIVAFVCLRTYMCTSTCFLKGGPVVIAAPPGRAGPGRWAPTSQNKEVFFDILSSDKFVALFLDLTNQLTVMKTGDDWSAVHHAAVQLLLDAKALAQPRAKAGSRTTQSDAAHDKLRTTMQAFVGAWHALTSDITTMHPSDLDRVTATLLVPPPLRQQSVLLGKTLNGLPIPPFQADSSCAYECLQTSALWLKWAAGPLGAVHRVALLLARDPFWVIYDADVQTWIPFRSTHPSVPSPYKTPSDVLRPQDASRVDSIICLRSEPALGLLGQPMITADAFRLQAHIMTTVEKISAKKTVKFSFDTLKLGTPWLFPTVVQLLLLGPDTDDLPAIHLATAGPELTQNTEVMIAELLSAVLEVQNLHLSLPWSDWTDTRCRLCAAVDAMLGIGGMISSPAAGVHWVASLSHTDRSAVMARVGVASCLAAPHARQLAAQQTLHSLFCDPSLAGTHYWPDVGAAHTFSHAGAEFLDYWAPPSVALLMDLSSSTSLPRVLFGTPSVDSPGNSSRPLYLACPATSTPVLLGTVTGPGAVFSLDGQLCTWLTPLLSGPGLVVCRVQNLAASLPFPLPPTLHSNILDIKLAHSFVLLLVGNTSGTTVHLIHLQSLNCSLPVLTYSACVPPWNNASAVFLWQDTKPIHTFLAVCGDLNGVHSRDLHLWNLADTYRHTYWELDNAICGHVFLCVSDLLSLWESTFVCMGSFWKCCCCYLDTGGQ